MNGVGRDPRVLVVEDDDEIAQVLQRSLRLDGYDVRIAGDGEAALDQAAAYHPDLVILDLGLPKLDGIEVARRLRAADDVPILMLTARDAVESRVEGLDAGSDDYLVKPFERQELLARLRALLRRRPPRGSASLVVSDLALNPDTHEVARGGGATPDELGGATVADALLEPTVIYVRAVLELLGSGIPVHGLAHITGGGLLNLLRLTPAIGFEISEPLPVPPIFSLVQQHGGVSDAEMWEV